MPVTRGEVIWRSPHPAPLSRERETRTFHHRPLSPALSQGRGRDQAAPPSPLLVGPLARKRKGPGPTTIAPSPTGRGPGRGLGCSQSVPGKTRRRRQCVNACAVAHRRRRCSRHHTQSPLPASAGAARPRHRDAHGQVPRQTRSPDPALWG